MVVGFYDCACSPSRLADRRRLSRRNDQPVGIGRTWPVRPLTLVGRSFWGFFSGFFFFVFFVAQLYELLACGLVGLEWARALASLGCDWLCHMANLLSDDDDDDADELVRALCCRGRAASDVGPDCTRAHSKLSSPCLLSEIQMKAQSCSLKSSLLNLISVARIRLAFKSNGRTKPNQTWAQKPTGGRKLRRLAGVFARANCPK